MYLPKGGCIMLFHYSEWWRWENLLSFYFRVISLNIFAEAVACAEFWEKVKLSENLKLNAVISASLYAASYLCGVFCADPVFFLQISLILTWFLFLIFAIYIEIFPLLSNVFSPSECQRWRMASSRGWSWKASTHNIHPCTLSSLWPKWVTPPLPGLIDLNDPFVYLGFFF